MQPALTRTTALLATLLLAAATAACTGSSSGDRTAPGGGATTVTAPTAGSGPGTPTPAATGATTADWPTYHGDPARTGSATGPVLRPPLRRAWSVTLDGALYAQPLVVGEVVVAATENDTVYAVDRASGRVRWKRHLAAPARRADLPCGNIDPSGITGTPAYDRATRQILVATEDSRAHHTLWALDESDGRTRWQRSLDVLADRDRYAEQQRGALLVTAGRVYVPFGGRAGDCGNYVGYVVGVPLSGAGAAVHYAVPTAREAGAWAPPGPIVGPGGALYLAVGNGAEVGGRYDGSDSVLRLSPTLVRTALFAPPTWAADNAQDLDLGSMGPVPVGGRILIAGKRAVVYLLAAGLGGHGAIGGALATLDGCAGFGGAAVHGTTVLLPCNGGIRALEVRADRLRWLWRSSLGGSPVIAGDVAYAFDGADLVEVDLHTGHRRARLAVGSVTRFTTPVPAGDLVVVGTTSRLVAVRGAPGASGR